VMRVGCSSSKLNKGTVTQKNRYKKEPLHKGTVTQRNRYTKEPLHKGTVTQRNRDLKSLLGLLKMLGLALRITRITI
jgi:hypothetical protein